MRVSLSFTPEMFFWNVCIRLQDSIVSSQNTNCQHGETPKTWTRIKSWFVIILLECRFTWHICTPSLNKDYMVEVWISRIRTRFILVRMAWLHANLMMGTMRMLICYFRKMPHSYKIPHSGRKWSAVSYSFLQRMESEVFGQFRLPLCNTNW